MQDTEKTEEVLQAWTTCRSKHQCGFCFQFCGRVGKRPVEGVMISVFRFFQAQDHVQQHFDIQAPTMLLEWGEKPADIWHIWLWHHPERTPDTSLFTPVLLFMLSVTMSDGILRPVPEIIIGVKGLVLWRGRSRYINYIYTFSAFWPKYCLL